MNNVIYKTNLQRMRVRKGLSQSELSAQTGISLRTIQCYERASRIVDNAGLKVLCTLSMHLNCRPDELLEDRELAQNLKKAFKLCG